MRTAKEIMKNAFHEALLIVAEEIQKTNDPNAWKAGDGLIAASNLAIAIFSYEAEQEALNEATQQSSDEDSGFDDDLGFPQDKAR